MHTNANEVHFVCSLTKISLFLEHSALKKKQNLTFIAEIPTEFSRDTLTSDNITGTQAPKPALQSQDNGNIIIHSKGLAV